MSLNNLRKLQGRSKPPLSKAVSELSPTKKFFASAPKSEIPNTLKMTGWKPYQRLTNRYKEYWYVMENYSSQYLIGSASGGVQSVMFLMKAGAGEYKPIETFPEPLESKYVARYLSDPG